MQNKFFLHQIKRTNGTIEKGIVVKDTIDEVKQSYHAYLGAYAYGKDTNTDYVKCMIDDMLSGTMHLEEEVWIREEAEPATGPAEE